MTPLGVRGAIRICALLAAALFVAGCNTPGKRVGAEPVPPQATPTTLAVSDVLSDPSLVGQPWGGKTSGLLTFRGNPTRTFYGTGPMPSSPVVQWEFPEKGRLCRDSTVGGETKQWCGTGWTGQPAVFERAGRTWVVFGAYDGAVHFLDAATGRRILPDFQTDDIIKGSVTIDPDGYPLVYTGSRDNYYRVIAIDGDEPREVWKLAADAVKPSMWNNDWDGAGLILDGHLVVGGENGQIHVVRLNRATDARGRVTVDPELIWHAPGWDDELLRDIGDRNVSIESSVAVSGDTVWFGNSGGLIQGWDLGPLFGRPGDLDEPERIFRFWTGDDTDASVVIDEEGALYVASEWDRRTARAAEVGQVVKLEAVGLDDERSREEPASTGPVVWSLKDQKPLPGQKTAGVWATPALHRDVLYVATDGGRLIALDRDTGEVRWSKKLPGPTWSSPVVVDDVLLQGDCEGELHAYDVRDTTVEPTELWSVQLAGCIESTPAVWRGRIYVGTRGGTVVAIGD